MKILILLLTSLYYFIGCQISTDKQESIQGKDGKDSIFNNSDLEKINEYCYENKPLRSIWEGIFCISSACPAIVGSATYNTLCVSCQKYTLDLREESRYSVECQSLDYVNYSSSNIDNGIGIAIIEGDECEGEILLRDDDGFTTPNCSGITGIEKIIRIVNGKEHFYGGQKLYYSKNYNSLLLCIINKDRTIADLKREECFILE